ncbi:dinucleotide-utilizing enzyme possibly involved in molybdopterin or thiamin biosynthesis [Desulfosporosinus orientis DSM 765]|uniref:Dinucleotide-utilizing enzyme possibly involved in molybdopterin or thiamin biosynthesis n=1 Tax=Desulfosporosinus orientis (strain ATCC 19365 / DSM 765 / NCIMB 8382 / VKM B-1628 / Singapore I) TaxID=768706 RepID=G7WEQ8_DESOD|nr:HesA/MoeB/ThiF family protein [Desulfosporosinus orientis]AET66949.1 dinucleotide-utilizing enzyme possibly involved in molybdopterin or thiamin biosynthesis [Desulfosporosinus orientis DSM 765]
MNFDGRYVRNKKTLSDEDQHKLANSCVAIVGCGGLGGYIAEELARIGVGRLVLIDGDCLEVSNLNRQIMATELNIGQWKVEAALERLRSVNSDVGIEVIRGWFEEKTGSELLREADLVCDALDSREARVGLERVCHQLGRPLVFASIAGWFGQLGVSMPGDFSVRRLFGRGESGVERTWGNPAFTPAVLASLSVAEAVKLLVGRVPSLRHAWLQVDLLSMEFERFEIQ